METQKKTKLVALLKRLGDTDFNEGVIIQDILTKIEEVRNEIPDISPYFYQIKGLQSSHGSLASALSMLSDILQKEKEKIDTQIKENEKTTTSLAKGINKNHKELSEAVETLRLESLKPKGGGSMPLQVSINGTVANVRYSDVNYIVSGATVANNNTTHKTDITIPIGSSSPLTTKGDLYGFDTAGDRIPVGSNGKVLTANSAAALGVDWETPTGGSQTPWTSDIDGGGFNLTDVNELSSINLLLNGGSGSGYPLDVNGNGDILGQLGIGMNNPQYALDIFDANNTGNDIGDSVYGTWRIDNSGNVFGNSFVNNNSSSYGFTIIDYLGDLNYYDGSSLTDQSKNLYAPNEFIVGGSTGSLGQVLTTSGTTPSWKYAIVLANTSGAINGLSTGNTSILSISGHTFIPTQIVVRLAATGSGTQPTFGVGTIAGTNNVIPITTPGAFSPVIIYPVSGAIPTGTSHLYLNVSVAATGYAPYQIVVDVLGYYIN